MCQQGEGDIAYYHWLTRKEREATQRALESSTQLVHSGQPESTPPAQPAPCAKEEG